VLQYGSEFPSKGARERKKKKKYIHSPHTPTWHSAELVKHRDNFNLLLFYRAVNETKFNATSIYVPVLRK
jgi:hypothetical protein